jgi:hypothetical protein
MCAHSGHGHVHEPAGGAHGRLVGAGGLTHAGGRQSSPRPLSSLTSRIPRRAQGRKVRSGTPLRVVLRLLLDCIDEFADGVSVGSGGTADHAVMAQEVVRARSVADPR